MPATQRLWTFFGPWGRNRSQSPSCWIFRVKQIHPSTASARTRLEPQNQGRLQRLSSVLTLLLLKWLFLFFNHLKLELLTQFPASNDEKQLYLYKIFKKLIKKLFNHFFNYFVTFLKTLRSQSSNSNIYYYLHIYIIKLNLHNKYCLLFPTYHKKPSEPISQIEIRTYNTQYVMHRWIMQKACVCVAKKTRKIIEEESLESGDISWDYTSVMLLWHVAMAALTRDQDGLVPGFIKVLWSSGHFGVRSV